MKNFFKKIKSYSFWVSLSGAIIVLLNALGNAFGFEIENKVVEDCIMSFASLLVVFGIVSNGKNSKNEEENEKQNDILNDVGEKGNVEEIVIEEKLNNDVEEEIVVQEFGEEETIKKNK